LHHPSDGQFVVKQKCASFQAGIRGFTDHLHFFPKKPVDPRKMNCQGASGQLGQMTRYYSDTNTSCAQGGGCQSDRWSELHQQGPQQLSQMTRYYSDTNTSCPQGGGCRSDEWSALHQQGAQKLNQMTRYYSDTNTSCAQGGGCQSDRWSELHQQGPQQLSQMTRYYSDTNTSCAQGGGCQSDRWSELHQQGAQVAADQYAIGQDLRMYQQQKMSAAVERFPANHVPGSSNMVPRPGFGPWPTVGLQAPFYSDPTQKPVLIFNPQPGAQASLMRISVSCQ
jgi:hypothetical protein